MARRATRGNRDQVALKHPEPDGHTLREKGRDVVVYSLPCSVRSHASRTFERMNPRNHGWFVRVFPYAPRLSAVILRDSVRRPGRPRALLTPASGGPRAIAGVPVNSHQGPYPCRASKLL